MAQYWLVKSEPDEYSWSDLKKAGRDVWDGIRNYQARNFMRDMRRGDTVLFYHTGKERSIVGLASVIRTAFPDPSAGEAGDWSAVELKSGRRLKHPVTLAQIKADNALKNCYLVRNSRLSVMPITADEYNRVLELSEKS